MGVRSRSKLLGEAGPLGVPRLSFRLADLLNKMNQLSDFLQSCPGEWLADGAILPGSAWRQGGMPWCVVCVGVVG